MRILDPDGHTPDGEPPQTGEAHACSADASIDVESKANTDDDVAANFNNVAAPIQ